MWFRLYGFGELIYQSLHAVISMSDVEVVMSSHLELRKHDSN